MWTAPGSQEVKRRADRIACDHMSGLLMRSHMTAAKMGSATRVPNMYAVWNHRWVPRSVSRLGSIDHAICSVSSKLRPPAGGEVCRHAELGFRVRSVEGHHVHPWWQRSITSFRPTAGARSAARRPRQGWLGATAEGGAKRP